jgi:hypothetical protein
MYPPSVLPVSVAMFDLRWPCTLECIYIYLAFNLMCLQNVMKLLWWLLLRACIACFSFQVLSLKIVRYINF